MHAFYTALLRTCVPSYLLYCVPATLRFMNRFGRLPRNPVPDVPEDPLLPNSTDLEIEAWVSRGGVQPRNKELARGALVETVYLPLPVAEQVEKLRGESPRHEWLLAAVREKIERDTGG